MLGARPVHHDEGMLAYFAWKLAREGSYNYTPQIHAPILFYLQAALFRVFGESIAVLRGSMAIFGVILCLIPLVFIKTIGKTRAIILSLIFLTSPLFGFYSRFLVHTGLVVVFWFAFIFSLKRFLTKFNYWDLHLSAAFLALAFGISETTYIFLAPVALFIVPFFIFASKKFIKYLSRFAKFVREDPYQLVSAILIFLLIWILVYSVGLTNYKSLAISAPNPFNKESGLGFWFAQQPTKLGSQPWYYYLILLALYEPVVLVGSVFGLINIYKKKSVFYWFLCWLVLTSMVAFSYAGEKFPWLFLAAALPTFLLAGYYIGGNWKNFKLISKIIFVILFVWAAVISIRLNYFNVGDTREMAVYVQTPAVFQKEINKILSVCKPINRADCVLIDQKISWPLSWSFRDLSTLIYADNFQTQENTKFVIIGNENYSQVKIDDSWKKQEIYLRDWWVPTRHPGLKNYLKYYFLREIWNEKGGYNVTVYSR